MQRPSPAMALQLPIPSHRITATPPHYHNMDSPQHHPIMVIWEPVSGKHRTYITWQPFPSLYEPTRSSPFPTIYFHCIFVTLWFSNLVFNVAILKMPDYVIFCIIEGI